MITNIRLLFIFFSITIMGSALSIITAFLSLDKYFHSMTLLAFALSARTFSAFIFSYCTNKIIKFFGIKKSLIISQIFGLFALFILASGFYFNIFFVTICGIMMTCFPAILVSILMSTIFRVKSSNENSFRKYSGSRELIAGIAGILAAILAPLILLKFSINISFIIDGISYLISIILLKTIKLSFLQTPVEPKKSILPMNKIFLKSDTIIFIFQTSASLLLAGLIPLMASAQNIKLTVNLPILIREWFWSIDQAVAIIASSIYIAYTHFLKKPWLTPILILNSVWLMILMFLHNSFCIPLIVLLISLLVQISFQKFRDDFILSADNNIELINSYSAIAFAQKNFIYFISPLILTAIFNLPTLLSIILIIVVQIVLYLLFKISQMKIVNQKFPGVK